ncbi:MAG: right-handed parallel beta-helix repeat-containing protein [Thermoguttaceae bacterium]|nr:right-handed parallel beta-helix repeat-containing protein [Thermoguttaceae bacterium]
MKRIAIFALSLLLSLTSALAQEQTIEVNRIVGDDFVTGKTPDVSSGAFTFAMRVKLLGQAESKGNGDGLGMLFSVASGYFDGIRAHYSWINQRVTFQIGKNPSAVSLGSDRGILPGVLHDVVCTYDGKTMKLWLDGKLAGEREYVAVLNTKGAPIKVGNGGYGVGANRMYVDCLKFYPRALTEKEIVARFENEFPKEEKKTLTLLQQYAPVFGAYNATLNKDALECLLNQPGLPEDLRNKIQGDYLFSFGTESQIAQFAEEEAEKLLSSTDSKPTRPQDQAKRTSRLWSIARRLEQTNQTELLNKLKEKFDAEFSERDEIDRLIQSAERLRDLERKALEQEKGVVSRSPQFTIYVSTSGADANPGTQSAPTTLNNALVLAKTWQNDNPGQTVEIALLGGTYYIDKTVNLNELQNVVIASAAGEQAVLTGAKTLTQFQPVTDKDVFERLPESVRGKVLECDLKAAGVTDFGQLRPRGYGVGDTVNPVPSLYVNGEAQTLARYPNVGEEPLKFGAVKGNSFGYDFDRPDKWRLSDNPDENDVWANGLFTWEWASHIKKVQIDREKKTMSVDGVNLTGRFHYYLINILEELDSPGEYFVDRQRGMLYYLPAADQLDAKGRFQAAVEFPVLNERLFHLTNCKNVVLNNLTLKNSRESGVLMENCVCCYVTNSTIEQLGGNAAILRGGSLCGVVNCRIREMGASGVRLSGGDRSTLAPACHIVHNCEISDFSRIDRAYAPAVHTSGCGFVITNNLVYDSPHHAFRTDGNDIYVARNEVHSVVYEFSDQAGIDVYGNPTYRGIVIEKNFWHDIQGLDARCGQAGIRLDDAISGVVMIGNVFYRCSGGIFGGIQIHGGHDNVCLQNVFVDCNIAFSFSPWNNSRYSEFIQRFSQYVNPLYHKTYPTMNRIHQTYNRNYIFNNAAIDCKAFLRSGDWNVYLDNTFSTPNVPAPDGTPFDRREWIKTLPGVPSLEGVGVRRQ